MALDQKVGIFTTTMRTEFQVAYEATAAPAPWEQYTTKVPSTARIEHYTWMTPAPGLGLYQGHRRYGKLDTVKYSVENKEFDAAFSVLLRDIEDDQTGGYALKPRELAERAKLWPGRWTIKHLAAGKTRTAFDGAAFFADSHTIGVGDNLLAATGSANADGATYRLAVLHTGGPLKPLLWQDRKPPKFMDSAGTPQSSEAKEVHYWIDLEGQAAYGYWWDAVLLEWTNLPTVAEFHTGLQNVTDSFRSFQLPKALTSDDGEYIHEQTEFNDGNLVGVGSPKLERIAAQALGQEMIPMTIAGGQGTGGGTAQTIPVTNLYKKYLKFIPSKLIDG